MAPPRSGKVTIQDVARAAGVSITTVSRYLNGRYDSMSEETKERIETVIRALDYRPNRIAQALKGSRSGIIAAIVVNLGYPLCVSVIRSLSEELEAVGYSLLVAETRGDPVRERRLLEAMRAQSVDALVTQTNGSNNDLLRTWLPQRPVVWFDRGFNIPGGIDVVTNNYEASLTLTRHLFAQGYRRVVYVTEPLENISTRTERLHGYRQACAEAGREPWVVWARRGQVAELEAVVTELAADRCRQDLPVAVYTANGLVMQALYPLLRRLPYNVPFELGLATFDEPDWAQIATPGLTCVRQPTEEMGRWIARTLAAQLQGDPQAKDASEARVHVLPSELRIGPSTLRQTANSRAAATGTPQELV